MAITKKGKQVAISSAIYALLFAGASYINPGPGATGDCGGSPKSRWEKKILVDDGVGDINFKRRLQFVSVRASTSSRFTQYEIA